MKRLSICENTTPGWTFQQDVENYKNAGIFNIAIGYDKIRDMKIDTVLKVLMDSGMNVSSLLLTGFFTLTAKDRRERKSCISDSLEAIELAHRLEADYLLVLSGPPCRNDGGLKAAEKITRDSLRRMAPMAEKLDVKLGLEILHPVYQDTWSAVCTLDQGLNIIDDIDSEHVGLVLDLYHIHWDPRLSEGIKRAAGKIIGVHIDDWRLPTEDVLKDRTVMGEGIIPVGSIVREIIDTGYEGAFEVEILSDRFSVAEYPNLLEAIIAAYNETIGPVL